MTKRRSTKHTRRICVEIRLKTIQINLLKFSKDLTKEFYNYFNKLLTKHLKQITLKKEGLDLM